MFGYHPVVPNDSLPKLQRDMDSYRARSPAMAASYGWRSEECVEQQSGGFPSDSTGYRGQDYLWQLSIEAFFPQMSKRNWVLSPPIGVGLAIILALAAAAVLGEHNHYVECSERRFGQDCGHELGYVSRAIVAPFGGSEAPAPKPYPEREEWRSERDLEAQWDQVYWAKWSALSAWAAFLMGVVGILFVKRTLDATRVAVEQATEANRLTRESHEVEQRPWLSIRPELDSNLTFEDQGFKALIGFKMKNTGQSPALNVMIRARLMLVRKSGEAEAALERIMTDQTRYYAGLRRPDPAIIGDNLFPEEEHTIPRRLSFDGGQVRKFTGGRPDAGVSPTLVASVSYRSALNAKRVHHTGVIYDILKPATDGSGRSHLIGVHDHAVPMTELKLEKTSTFAD